MAKFYKYVAVGCWLLTAGVFSSCQEGSEAGDLLGLWRLDESDHHYMAISGAITEFRIINNSHLDRQVYGNFQHQGDSLFIQCYSINEEIEDTIAVEEEFGFKPFNNIRVKIEVQNGDILVLSKDGQKWNFRKY